MDSSSNDPDLWFGVDLSEIGLAAQLYSESLDVVHGDYLRCLLVGTRGSKNPADSLVILMCLPGAPRDGGEAIRGASQECYCAAALAQHCL